MLLFSWCYYLTSTFFDLQTKSVLTGKDGLNFVNSCCNAKAKEDLNKQTNKQTEEKLKETKARTCSIWPNFSSK